MKKSKGLTPIKFESAPQMRDKVYEQLRQAIINGSLKPGERLVERRLAEQLGVSRTPVREATRMLELEGLVKYLPRLGAVVAQVSDTEVIEIYRIRAVLEGLAARMAAEKIKPEQIEKLNAVLKNIEKAATAKNLAQLEQEHRQFNDLIYRTAGSPRLYDMINTLVDHIQLYTRVGYCQPGRIEEATREHRQLVEAIGAKNSDQAEHIARKHIDNSRQAYFIERTQKDKTGKTSNN